MRRSYYGIAPPPSALRSQAAARQRVSSEMDEQHGGVAEQKTRPRLRRAEEHGAEEQAPVQMERAELDHARTNPAHA